MGKFAKQFLSKCINLLITYLLELALNGDPGKRNCKTPYLSSMGAFSV